LKLREVTLTALVMCGLSLSRGAQAEPVDDKTRNAARSLAEQGRDVYDKGDFERARDLFHRAYALVPAPTIALYEGRSLAKLGRLVQAQEAYLRAVRTQLNADSPEPFRKAVHEAEGEEVALEPRIPKVTLTISGPGAQGPELTVTVDGEPTKPELLGVEMPINPGPHVVLAAALGGDQARVPFSIDERERKSVEIKVAAAKIAKAAPPPPPPVEKAPPSEKPAASPSSWQKPAAFAAGGVGVVGLATGIITGSMAAARYSDAKSQCPNHVCVEGSAGQDKLDSFRSLRTVSTIGYIVGGVGLAASITLFVLLPSDHAEGTASAGVWLGANGGGVMGAF
jgi:hypothetical protein